MRKLVESWGAWFATCSVIGSVPGAVCWALWFWFDGFATFSF